MAWPTIVRRVIEATDEPKRVRVAENGFHAEIAIAAFDFRNR